MTFIDGTQAEAELKQSDANTGFAIVTVALSDIDDTTKEQIAYASLGNSMSKALVGSPVIAVGNPMGTSGSVSYGVITSVGNPIYMKDANYALLTTDMYGSQKRKRHFGQFKGTGNRDFK